MQENLIEKKKVIIKDVKRKLKTQDAKKEMNIAQLIEIKHLEGNFPNLCKLQKGSIKEEKAFVAEVLHVSFFINKIIMLISFIIFSIFQLIV